MNFEHTSCSAPLWQISIICWLPTILEELSVRTHKQDRLYTYTDAGLDILGPITLFFQMPSWSLSTPWCPKKPLNHKPRLAQSSLDTAVKWPRSAPCSVVIICVQSSNWGWVPWQGVVGVFASWVMVWAHARSLAFYEQKKVLISLCTLMISLDVWCWMRINKWC